MPHSPSVPSSFQGYHYQVIRLFTRLWTGEEGDIVCLEHFDDIVHKKDKNIITAEQAKLYLSTNPASKWSPAFWNAIKNWIKLLTDKPNLIPNIYFVYCCNTSYEPEELVTLYNDVVSDEQATAAKNKTLQLLNSSKIKTRKQEISDMVNNPLFTTIIRKFEFIREVPEAEDNIDKQLSNAIPEPNQAKRVKAYLLGWIYNYVSDQFKKGIEMHVPRAAFRKEYQSFWNRLRANPLSAYSIETSNTCSEEEKRKCKNSKFIAQLDLIDCGKREKETAIIDFITANNAWAKMANEAAVNEESYQIFKDEIKSDWEIIKTIEVRRNNPVQKKDIGKIIYAQTLLLKTRLQGQDCPARFVQGTCQDLSDRLLIGWHPDYEKEIK
jgi:hypothetical protein